MAQASFRTLLLGALRAVAVAVLVRGTLVASTQTAQSPINFDSDALEYRQTDEVIVASGNVTVRQTSYTFQSDYALFNIANKSLKAWGDVRFQDLQKNKIRSKFLTYNADNGSARLEHADGSFGPFLFATRLVERDAEGNFTLEKARLSTCETDLSKYHLYGYRIRVMPKRRITVLHALFRVGPVPVLYLPYYYYSLGEKHLAFQIFPGTSQSEGAFVRTVWGYPFTDDTYVKLYLDQMARRGFGSGGEFNYYYSDKAKGSLYGYRVYDQLNHRERWNARLAHWQTFGRYWTLQSNANRLSDDAFPNDFFREDFNRVVRDFRSNAALTRQQGRHIFRLVAERQDLFDSFTNKFYSGEELAPRAEYTLTQAPLGFWGLEAQAGASFTNRFAGISPNRTALRTPDPLSISFSTPVVLDRAYRRESDLQFTLLNSFRLLPSTILIPRVTLRGQWLDRPQGSEPAEKFVQRIETESTLRQTVKNTVDLDFTYKLTRRLQANQGDDLGLEDHRLGFLSWVRPNPWMSLRFETAHQLPRFRDESLAFLERRNYYPLRTELSLTPRRPWEFFWRNDYLLADPNTGSAHLMNTQAEWMYGRRELGDDYALLGASYFAARDDAFELRQSVRHSFSKRWKVEATVRETILYRNGNAFNVRAGEFTEKEVVVKTFWRCWDFSLLFRERKGVFEFLFNLELQLDREEREKNAARGKSSEFYPWRSAQ